MSIQGKDVQNSSSAGRSDLTREEIMAKKKQAVVAASPSEFTCSCGSVLKGKAALRHPKKASCEASGKTFRRPTFQLTEI